MAKRAADADDGASRYDGDDEALRDVINISAKLIDDAVDHMEGDFYPQWEDAEEFFNGLSDVPIDKGRSRVVMTVVRDAVRNLKPSLMRVFLSTSNICEYAPRNVSNTMASQFAVQQTMYANQTFWNSGGYSALLLSVHNALLKKVGILKTYYKPMIRPEYSKVGPLTADELQALGKTDGVTIMDYEEIEVELPPQGATGMPDGPHMMPDGTMMDAPEPETYYIAEVVTMSAKGRLAVENVSLEQFFIDDEATGCDDFRVIGQRRNVTVSLAKSMGLEYDDWMGLTTYDLESANAVEDELKKGYMPDGVEQFEIGGVDESQHMFLLTEAYMWFDLDDLGIAQLYKFYFGSIDYKYISHERVDEQPFSLGQIDPQPDASIGKSIYDIMKERQNTNTSLMRATVDNAHAANDRRLAYHETLVNGADVANRQIGAPIRFRQAGMIQEIGVSPTIGAMLPLMQYLDMDGNKQIGITDAAVGLDPDALQSTDKEAVQNTIKMSQGQTELMARNFAETGLAPAFNKLLRLSILHADELEPSHIMVSGKVIPVNVAAFDPDMTLRT